MKFIINDEVNSLAYFNRLIETSKVIEIQDTLVIEPFNEFSTGFGNVYWYFKYLLLKDQASIKILNDDIYDEFKDFFFESDINIIWINILDRCNYEINCIDGNFYVSIFNMELMDIVKKDFNKWDNVLG